MNEHAGLGSLLSVAIVVGFTLLFHESERRSQADGRPSDPRPSATRTTPSPSPIAAAVAADDHLAAVDAPLARPLVAPAANPIVVREVELRGPRPRVLVSSTTIISNRQDRVLQAPLPGEVVPQAAPRLEQASLPALVEVRRSSSTVIERGERLVDVAIRVYGSAEAVGKLWRANRERLASVDAAVAEGWLLRTP